MSDLTSCFGIYYDANAFACARCSARARCRAIQTTNGYDIVASLVSQLYAELPEGRYEDSEHSANWVLQLKHPPKLTVVLSASLSNQGSLEPDLSI